jgi:hypothetical protein
MDNQLKSKTKYYSDALCGDLLKEKILLQTILCYGCSAYCCVESFFAH